MINPDNITFPVSLEDFVKLQEQAAGRKLSKDEYELSIEITAAANTSYFAILKGRLEDVAKLLTNLEDALGGDKALKPIVAKFHVWMQKAVKQAIAELEDPVAGGPLPN